MTHAVTAQYGAKVTLLKSGAAVSSVRLDGINIPYVAKVELIAEPGEVPRLVLTIHVSEVHTESVEP